MKGIVICAAIACLLVAACAQVVMCAGVIADNHAQK